jgi:DegV family protein with EDD domain
MAPRRFPQGCVLTVGVVTDSAASLPPELAGDAGITVVPMWLTLGEVSARDGEVDVAELARFPPELVTTSAPTPGDFATAIEAAERGDGVLVVTLAAAMSATYDAARLAASLAGGRARVLDSGTAAGAEGLVALAAAEAAAGGAPLEQVDAAARRAAEEVRLVATLPSLEHLARGGRVPSVAAWAGRALGVQPVFEFRSGAAHPHRPAIGRAHALERILAAVLADRGDATRLRAAALHASDPDAAAAVLAEVERRAEIASSFVGSFSPVMVTHTGPSLVGLAWRWERP